MANHLAKDTDKITTDSAADAAVVHLEDFLLGVESCRA
jgi:hypothetical protein